MVGDNAFALSDARKNCTDKDYEKIIVRKSIKIIGMKEEDNCYYEMRLQWVFGSIHFDIHISKVCNR